MLAFQHSRCRATLQDPWRPSQGMCEIVSPDATYFQVTETRHSSWNDLPLGMKAPGFWTSQQRWREGVDRFNRATWL